MPQEDSALLVGHELTLTPSRGVSILAPPREAQRRHRSRRPHVDSLHFAESRHPAWVMALSEVVASQLSLLIGLAIKLALTMWLFSWWPLKLNVLQITQLSAGLLVIPVGLWFAGFYPGYGLTDVERLRRRCYVTVVVTFGMLLWASLSPRFNQPDLVCLVVVINTLLLGPLMEMIVRAGLIRAGKYGTPVVILGAGRTGELAIESLRRHNELGLVPVAVFDQDEDKWGQSLHGVPVIGPVSWARKKAYRAKIALIAMPGLPGGKLANMANRLPFERVIVVPDLMGLASLWVGTRDMGGLLGLEVRNYLVSRRNWWVKRIMDLLLGVPMLLLALPIMGVMALWIRWVSPGASAFYAQKRVGFGGRMITVWKLRTMYPDADAHLERHISENPDAHDEWHRCNKLRNDPRILPGIGHLLRKTSLDELPQLWNVVRGDMSLVGPRPFPDYHLDRFDTSFRALRRTVVPGLTGLWQAYERNSNEMESQQRLDSYYIRNWSIWLDLHVLARTIWVVLSGKGAC